MVRKLAVGIVLSVVLTGHVAFAGGPAWQGPPARGHFLGRLAPRGGWHPDAGGLFHWWDPDCFARPCGVDDYCRKPMPRPHCVPRPACVGHGHGHPCAHACAACAGGR